MLTWPHDHQQTPNTPGIQSILSAAVGTLFTADIYVTVVNPGTGLSAYGFSVRFDNTELTLNGAPSEWVPPGAPTWGNATVGVGGVNNNIGGGLGQVSWIEAADFSFKDGLAVGTTFLAASVPFKVVGVANDGAPDIMPGLFDLRDGLVDNAAAIINNVAWNTGAIVPEPAAASLVLGAAALVGGLLLRRPWRTASR